MKTVLAKVISSPVKPYRGKLTRQDKKVIDEAILAWSNDTIGEAIDFEDLYGLSPKEFMAENMGKCLALYGNKKAVTIYRALHFPTRNKLVKFIDSLDNGVLVEKQIRSWTTDKDVAMSYYPEGDRRLEDNFSDDILTLIFFNGSSGLILEKLMAMTKESKIE